MLRVLGKRNQIMHNREGRGINQPLSMDSKLKCDEILEHCLYNQIPTFRSFIIGSACNNAPLIECHVD